VRLTWACAAGLLGACGSSAPPIHEIEAPLVYAARVVLAAGSVVAQPGDRCSVSVARTDDPRFNCRVVVDCSGDVVYGLGDGGFNECVFEASLVVGARDPNGSRVDGDPRMLFDARGGRLAITDDDPDVAIEMTLVADDSVD
jgi:hypothetical protein